MRNGISAAILALLVASASQASAQCRMCGHPGPYGMYDSFRVKIFRGGSIEQIPDSAATDPAEPEGKSVAKKTPSTFAPPSSMAKTATLNLRRTTTPAPAKSIEVQAGEPESLPSKEVTPTSSRRTIARQGDGALAQPSAQPGDTFRMKQPPRAGEAPPPPPVASPGDPEVGPDGLPKVDPAKGRIPKYRYSGSTYPYYFGRSYVNYPHYEQWHEPATDARRQNWKMKFLNTFFEPMMDFTHGVQVETDELPPKPVEGK